MDLEQKIQQYCETCPDEKCLDCQLHQFIELRRSGQSSSTKPTMFFQSENGVSLLSSSISTSFSHSASFEGRPGQIVRPSALNPLEKEIYEAYLNTSMANLIESVEVTGTKAVIVFAPSAAHDTNELAVSAAIRTLSSFTTLSEVEIRLSGFSLTTTSILVEQLLGREVLTKIAQDWSKLWDHLKPIKRSPQVMEKVFLFLRGDQNDAPSLIRSLLSH